MTGSVVVREIHAPLRPFLCPLMSELREDWYPRLNVVQLRVGDDEDVLRVDAEFGLDVRDCIVKVGQ